MADSSNYFQVSAHSAYYSHVEASRCGNLLKSRRQTFKIQRPNFHWTAAEGEVLEIYRVTIDSSPDGYPAVDFPFKCVFKIGTHSSSIPDELTRVWASYASYDTSIKFFVRRSFDSTRPRSLARHIDSYVPCNVCLSFPDEIDRITQNPKYILADKDTLIAASPFFRTMFESNFTEAKKTTFPAEVIKCLEKYIRGEIPHVGKGDNSDENKQDQSTTVIRQKGRIRSLLKDDLYEVPITGTLHDTYRAVYYYLENSQIFFARLTSLPLDTKTTDIKTVSTSEFPEWQRVLKESLTVPPKEVYELAHFLSLTKLQSLALKSYTSQLTPAIILAELFSDFSNSYREVEVACLKYAKENWKEVLSEGKALKKLHQTIKNGKLEGERAAVAIELLLELGGVAL